MCEGTLPNAFYSMVLLCVSKRDELLYFHATWGGGCWLTHHHGGGASFGNSRSASLMGNGAYAGVRIASITGIIHVADSLKVRIWCISSRNVEMTGQMGSIKKPVNLLYFDEPLSSWKQALLTTSTWHPRH